jgi:hypothetical protein
MKRVTGLLKSKYVYLGIVRYVLGLGMLPYAISKILLIQFEGSELHPGQLIRSFGGPELAWTFLGYSHWFTILLGFLELIPAILVLFRKTRLLGAILMLPMTASVFFINFAFDLWPATKLIASVMLFLNILVFVFESGTILTLVKIALQFRQKNLLTAEVIINILLIALVACIAFSPLAL